MAKPPATSGVQAPRPVVDPGMAYPIPTRDRLTNVLNGIWKDELGLGHVDPGATFLELGGDSFRALRIVTAIQQQLGIRLPLMCFWKAATLAAVTEALVHIRETASATLSANGRVVAPSPVSPVSPPEPANGGSGEILVSLSTPLVLDAGLLEQGVRAVLQEYAPFRSGSNCLDYTHVLVPDVPQRILREKIAHLVRAEAQRPFTEDGTLVRVQFIRPKKGDSWVIIHARSDYFDEWAAGVLVDQVSRLLTSGRPAPGSRPHAEVDPLWERAASTVPNSTSSTFGTPDYFRRRLADWRDVNLPGRMERATTTNRHPTPGADGPGALLALTFPTDLNRMVYQLARANNCSVFMVLLAALYALLASESGGKDLTVGALFANRSEPDAVRAVRPLAGYLPLRVELAGDLSFRELLAQVREVVLEGCEHGVLHGGVLGDRLFQLGEPAASEVSSSHLPRVLARYFPSYRPQRIRDGVFDTGWARAELVWSIYAQERRLLAMLEYSEDWYAESTALSLLQRWCGWLQSGSTSPERRLVDLAADPTFSLPPVLRTHDGFAPSLMIVQRQTPPLADRLPALQPTDSGRISIVVAAHVRSRRRVERLFRVLRQQSYPGVIEIILCDDGSPGPEGLRKACEAFGTTYLRIDRPPGRTNLMHKCRALNAGLRAAGGDFIFFLDQDMLPVPHHLQNCLNLIRSHGPDLVCYGRRRELVDLLGWSELTPSSRFHLNLDQVLDLLAKVDTFEPIPSPALGTPWTEVLGNNLVLSRSLVDRVGPLDETYEGYGMEDHDYLYRMHLQGAVFAHLDGLPIFHVGHPRQEHADPTPLLRNQAYFFRKFPEVRAVWPHLYARVAHLVQTQE